MCYETAEVELDCLMNSWLPYVKSVSMGLFDRRGVIHTVLDLECDCFSWFQHFQVSLFFRFVLHADAIILYENIN